ncbi:MAG: penicillin-binding protein activator [Pseudomonadota bacterium]
MPHLLNIPRRAVLRLCALLAAGLLAACNPTGGGGGPQIDTSAPVPVALLVPGSEGQSGEIAGLSRSLENAARLAVADLQGVQIDLRVYPTGGNANGASAAATRAVGEGARIIVGPLYAEAANAAGVAVASQGINVLTFSNNTAIAGGNVFVLGNTFDNVARRLASYSASQGKRDVLIVSAQSAAEASGRDAIVSAANQNRLNIVGNLSFPLSEAGIRGVAPQIASQVQATGADAIFFTSENAGAMGFLPQFLAEQGLSSDVAQYIGITRLDVGPGALAAPGIQGAWFALPDPSLNTNFRGRYGSAYGTSPHPLAGLAYDGIAAVGALVSQGRSDALTRGALTQGSGFVGVNGIFRFRSDGTNERGLAVAQIQNNRVVVIDAAPTRFGGAGF